MGYFTNGFVFTSLPDFDAASNLVLGNFARGYQHNQHSIWLLDLWKPRGKLQHRHSPFCDPAAQGFRMDLAAVDEATRAFLTTLERLRRSIGLSIQGAEISSVHIALAVATAARCSTFFFAADDDETDIGCNAVPNSLFSFGCRFDRLSVQYTHGYTAVTPLNYLEDNDEEGLEELIDSVNKVGGISVLEPRIIGGGNVLYENPVSQWSKAAGNPEEILGLGTWDPLLNFENDFSVVFEKLSS